MAGKMSETIIDKLSRQKDLLSSLPAELPSGISEAIDDAWQHKGRSAFEIASAVALGTTFTLLSRNPNEIIQKGVQVAAYAFTGLAAADLGSRFYIPMQDAWQNPKNLELDKKLLGRNIGDAIFNYGLAVASGGAGAYFGERALESRRLGQWLSGQKVTHFDNNSEKGFESVQDKFDSHMQEIAGPRQVKPHNAKFELRQFNDGTELITSSDGLAMLRPANGHEIWFKSQQNWWSPEPKIEALPGNPFKSAADSIDLENGFLTHQKNTWKFSPRNATEKSTIDVSKFTNRFFSWEKGGEGGVGAIGSQWAIERAFDVGSAIVQHKWLVDHSADDQKQEKK